MLAVLLATAALAAPVTLPATDIGATGATLNGTVDAPSTAYFEYGTGTSYGLRTADQMVPAGPVGAVVSGGLTVDTLYHYRIVSQDGTGEDMTFRTAGPPAVSNQTASNVTTSQATVSSSINTKGLRTSYRVEWGTSTNYGRFTPVVTADTGTATANVTLTGLQPNRTYHWRTRASNAAGTTVGADRTFRTAPLPTGVTLSLSQRTVPWGDGVRLGGRVTGSGVSGLTVALEQKRLLIDQDFTAAGTARTGGDGGYLFTIPQLFTTTEYRVRTQTTTVAVSPAVTARSQVRTSIRARHFARKRARIEGSVQPGVEGTIALQLHRPGRSWLRVRTATLTPATSSASRYRFIVRRLKRSARRFRVVASPSAGAHVRDWSSRVTVSKQPKRRRRG
jgi:Fibronectin type III domain